MSDVFSEKEVEEVHDDARSDDPTADAAVIKAGSLSPTEGVRAYLELRRMAELMNVTLTSIEPEETDVVHIILHARLPASVSFRLLPVHLKALKEVWDKPCSNPPQLKKLEAIYWI